MKKDKKKKLLERENIIYELPDFANKMILLLNAGMVLSSAFSKIVEDVDKNKGYFYSSLGEIYIRMKATNSPFSIEFREFARKTGVGELLRLSNIINDNFDKGTELVNKLDQEARFMWHMSKKQVEEKGRIAESRMTFPMAMMLMVLVVITIAPALMEL